jgi:hypothetical protein
MCITWCKAPQISIQSSGIIRILKIDMKEQPSRELGEIECETNVPMNNCRTFSKVDGPYRFRL